VGALVIVVAGLTWVAVFVFFAALQDDNVALMATSSLIWVPGAAYLMLQRRTSKTKFTNGVTADDLEGRRSRTNSNGVSPEDYKKSFESKWWRDRHRGLWDVRVNPNPVYVPPPGELEKVLQMEEAELAHRRDLREKRAAEKIAAQRKRWEAMAKNPSQQQSARDNWLASRRRPQKQSFGVSARGAEQLVADWLLYLGEVNVKTTRLSNDGGLDVTTPNFGCQVKNYLKQPVGVVEVRALLGAAVGAGLKPMLFTSSQLTSQAHEFCVRTEIPVVLFSAEAASLSALTPEATKLLKRGWYRA
jgi:hypothetical protein